MSYSIRYGPEIPESVPVHATAFGWIGVLIVFLVCAAALAYAAPEQMAHLREAMFPWEQPVVQEAFVEFRYDMDAGAEFQDALRDFCRQLLEADNAA